MEGEKFKGVSIGTWIAIFGLALNIGITYGIMQTSVKIMEAKIDTFEETVKEDKARQDNILFRLSEQQRSIDKNEQEIRHIRELREMQKQGK